MSRLSHTARYSLLLLLLLTGMKGLLQAQGTDVPFEKKFFRKEQQEKLRQAIKELAAGDAYFMQGKRATYLQALDHYLRANNFNPNNALLNYKIGKCYLNSLQKGKAEYFLGKAYRMDPGIATDIRFLLGQACHFNLDIDRALQFYTEYLDILRSGGPAGQIDTLERKIRECGNAKQMIANPVRVVIENTGPAINTAFPEYAPVITGDESKLLFTSSRDDNTGRGIDPSDLYYYEDIFITPRIRTGGWAVPVRPGKPLNSEYHDATVGLSTDGQLLLMYRGDNGGDLFESRLSGGRYSEPVRLPGPVNSPYHESSASYSADMKFLYFVSDRPGGSGFHDIYRCERRRDGTWGDPENLGPVINTPYNETGVFLHPDGKTLYFSSEGHNSMGGYDLFYAILREGKWSEPVSMGYPVNTADDDVFLVVSADKQHGYFASYRPDGYGEKDIYMLTFPGPEKPLVETHEDHLLSGIHAAFREPAVAPEPAPVENPLCLMKGTVFDAVTFQPMRASIAVYDLEKNEFIAGFHSDDKNGEYLLALPSGKHYGIFFSAEDYLYLAANVNTTTSVVYREFTHDIFLNPPQTGKGMVLHNLFFDGDGLSLLPASVTELEILVSLLQEMPGLNVEIAGHTDRQIPVSRQKSLSENRAKTVVRYLVDHGIPRSRLAAQGYGSGQPVITADTEEAVRINNRVECRITTQ